MKRVKFSTDLTINDLNKLGHAQAKKFAKQLGIPRQPHPSYKSLEHPTCSSPGCTNPKTVIEWHWTSGAPVYRPICNDCHNRRTAEKHGLKNIAEVVAKNAGFEKVAEYQTFLAKEKGFENVAEYQTFLAKEKGFSSLTEYKNSIHPYRRHRLDYCENRDGRLGYKCRFKIRISAQLETDHINGDPTDNRPENLQTLCCNCHTYKTHMNKDYATPGRKTLKLMA